MILIISFISSFKKYKVNPFPVLKLLYFFKTSYCNEVILITNPGKLFLAKGIPTFTRDFLPKLPNQGPKDLPD